MTAISYTETNVNWNAVSETLCERGYVIVKRYLSDTQTEELVKLYDKHTGYRKTVNMERHRFGRGEYKYFDYPLPQLVQDMRSRIYPELVRVANEWMGELKIGKTFPESLEELLQQCRSHNQLKATPLILKYSGGGFNTLHQDIYGDVYFPLQAVLFLNEPDVEYTGGEFVMTQQMPRAQSRAIVLKPRKGDLLIFTTNFRPVKGKNGYYKVIMKHGVSEIISGKRHTLGLIFHDAVS